MKEKSTQRDTTQSEVKNLLIGMQSSKSIEVTDADVEQALERFKTSVQGESVPDAWNMFMEHTSSLAHDDTVEQVTPFQQTGAETQPVARSEQPSAETYVEHFRKSMIRKRLQRVVSGIVAGGVLVGLLVSPVGAKAMAAAMQTMYFQNLFGVGQDDLTQIENALSTGAGGGTSHIDLKKYGSVEETGSSTSFQNLTYGNATKQLGYPIRKLPAFDAAKDTVNYGSARDITFRLNVNAINELIERLGGKTGFPQSANGQPIVLHIPAQVNENVGVNEKSMNLSEMKIPTVQVPSGVDLDQVRHALIDLPFLPGDIKQFLSTSQNWKNTIYVPTGGKATNLTINGNPAVLQTFNNEYFSIMWLEEGVLYQLNGSRKAFPDAGSLIAEAKELT